MRPTLRISSALALPLDTVVGTHAVLGRKRTGKTYKAKVMCEEMLAARQQVIVIDPTDAWWGLRSSSDGAGEGFPITIFGGRHGDLPLDPNAGVDLARAVIKDGFSAIFSLKGMSNAAEQRFCAGFLETLYTDNEQKPIHVFMDEADIYAPQQPQGEEMRTLGATKKIVRRAGLDGIGITLITQRPADLAKSVLTQCDTLIALGLSHPADLKPVNDWVRVQVKSVDLADELIESLPDLPKGDAWIWSPHHGIRKRVTFRDLQTFDSSRSPKPGEKQRPPRVLSKVDLDKLGQLIAASVEQAKQSDPKLLRAQVADLKRQLAKAASPAKPLPAAKSVKAPPVVTDKQLAHLDRLVAAADRVSAELDGRAAALQEKAQEIADQLRAGASAFMNSGTLLRHATMDLRDSVLGRTANGASQPRTARQPLEPARAPLRPLHEPIEVVSGNGEPIKLAKAELAILGAFVWLDQLGQRGPFERRTIGVIAGYSATSGHFENVLGRLRTAGLVEYPSGGMVVITDLGRKAAPEGDPIPSLEELHRQVRAKLTGAHQRILNVLIKHYPSSMHRAGIAEAAGFSSTSGHFENLLGRLRTLGLVDYPQDKHARAADLLFPEGFN